MRAPNPDERGVDLYESILSGDLVGDDSKHPFYINDNTYNLVIGSGTDATAILDGFTIAGANATCSLTSQGGGMRNVSGSPTVAGIANGSSMPGPCV